MKQVSAMQQGNVAALGTRLKVREIRESLDSSISKITHYHQIISLEEQKVRNLLSRESALLSMLALEEN